MINASRNDYSNSNSSLKTPLNGTFNDSKNPIEVDVGSISTSHEWTGSSNEIVFSVGGYSDHISIQTIDVYFKREEEQPREEIPVDPGATNLGSMTISEVKNYIASNPISVNSHKCGIDTKKYVTIKGTAVGKISLINSSKAFGLDVSYPNKIMMADETGYIAVSTTTGQGSFWNKVNNYQCKETSKYTVSGYLTTYLGQPELTVKSFSWDQSLSTSWNAKSLAKQDITIDQFYSITSNDIYYNCGGNAYGDVYTLKGLTCYNSESDGSGVRYYNFTDGTKNLRVNTYNISTCSIGSVYVITGYISLKRLSPIIVALDFKNSAETAQNIDFASISEDITIENLKKIHGSQDNTDTRYPDVINSFKKVYHTRGYLAVVEENYKYYIGVSDTYINRVLTGKLSSMANNNLALIKNDGFWNTTEEKLSLFNSYYQDYIFEYNPVDVYFVNCHLVYENGKACWEIMLLPTSIPEITK